MVSSSFLAAASSCFNFLAAASAAASAASSASVFPKSNYLASAFLINENNPIL